MERQKIYIEKPIDREIAVQVIAKNGYTVRIGKDKVGTRSVYFVEYWKERAE